MKCVYLFAVSALLLLPTIVRAQVATGTVQTGAPPFGTFGGGPDIIDLANLNAQTIVPVLNKQGRGLSLVFNIRHDSSIWVPVTSGSSQVWEHLNNWGWNESAINIGTALPTSVSVVETPEFCDNGLEKFVVSTTYAKWVYTDGFNIPHLFSGSGNVTDDQCTGEIDTIPEIGGALDGSGYTIQASGNTVTQLLGPDGSSITPNTGAGSVEDRNGNLISLGSNGVLTDTMGQAALTVTGTTITYPAPSGANAVYTLKSTPSTIRTNFGCSGISEFGPTSLSLITEIDLPDISVNPNDKYVVTYEATPGFPGDVTGRIASITLPTGGTISYSYSGGTGTSNSGIVCADGSTATLTRATPDGTWAYVHTENGQNFSTTVTDPQGNETIYNFFGLYQTERKVYQGTTMLLEDDVTCYNGNTTNCNTDEFSQPITERIVTDTLGSQQCQHVYKYNGTNALTEQDDYDYGNGAPGTTPIRKELITYAPLKNNILNQPSQIQIESGSGVVVAQTNVTYDEGSVVATSGTPQHISVSGSRGNPTTIKYTVAGSATLTKTFTYFDTGNVQTATDVNNAQTTYNYPDATSTCGNAFPTSVSEPLSLLQSMVWNCTGGVETSATDENGQTVSTAYTDAYFWRPASSSDQENNTTNYTYASQNSIESSLVFNSSHSATDILATLDALGRRLVTQKRQTPAGTTFDSVETDYDSLGRPSRTTMPYSGTVGQTNSTAPATTQTYDALNRPLLITDGGGGTATLAYTANDTLQTIGPAPTGENTKRRQSEYNSIGQLTSVCEVTSLTGSGACAQSTSATGYWTTYTYDALGNLLKVTQNAQGTGQMRNYSYDDLRRMTSETNPENGTNTYVYDSDSAGTCPGTYNGDLVKQVDNAGNVTCFTYDALHRVLSITYPSGPNSANSPSKFFVYDSATVNSVAMANAKARLAEAYTCTGSCSTKITDEGFSYTVRGEMSDVYESTPHSGAYFHVNELYWPNGTLNQISGLSGLPTLTYAPDGEGRVKAVSASSGQNPVTATGYNVRSQPNQVTFGSGDSDAFTFASGTFNMTQYKFTVGATPQTVVGTLTWGLNGTLRKLAITDAFNATNTQTCTYTYDDLARVASGNCGSVWSQTFSYDAFGNITKSGTNSFSPGYVASTNHMMTGATYDLNGDVLTDSLHSYAWSSDTRPTTIDTVTVTYDALGRMVEQSTSGKNTEIVYDPLGNKLALMNTTATLVTGFAPLPAGATAVYNASGLQYYRHADWLGSSRFSSTPTRTMFNDLAYAPFGEQYAQSGSTGVTSTSFAGMNEDTTTNAYDAMFREYGIQGRWSSPDPAGIAAANPANPQSWNRYAYVVNNPLAFIDPLGLTGPTGPCDATHTGPDPSGSGYRCTCDGTVCVWIPPVGQTVTVNGNPPPPIPTLTGPPAGLPAESVNNGIPGGPVGAPGSPQSPQQKRQACLDKINNTPDGKFYNFFSLLSPVLGPDPKNSTIEDVGGTALKFGTFTFFGVLGKGLPNNPFGSLSTFISEGIEDVAKGVGVPLIAAGTAGQVTAHVGCYVASHF